MSFSSTISINNAAGSAKAFKQIQSADPSGSLRLDDSTTLAQPRTFSIKHSTQTDKSGRVIDRHLLQFSATKNDTAGTPSSAIVNLTITLPRTGAVARADVDDLLAFAKNFLTTSNVDSLMINEA